MKKYEEKLMFMYIEYLLKKYYKKNKKQIAINIDYLTNLTKEKEII